MPEEMVKRSPAQEKYGRIQFAIRLVAVLVFLGWILLWIMAPTNTYAKKWSPQIVKKTISTYFGIQGSNILTFTFPILFIAVLGCVYLQIATKSTIISSSNDLSTMWKSPVLVKGPLGIVSSTELAFLLMFIALLIWSFTTYIYNSFPQITPKSAAAFGMNVWEARLDYAAAWLGRTGTVCLAFLFFPVARGSTVLPLLGLTSESCIKYHIWLGHIVMTIFTSHGICYIILWAATSQISQMLKWNKVGISIVAGEIALLAGLFLWVTTIPRIRRKVFELFFYAHYIYIIFIIFFVFHVGITYSPSMMLPGFYLFLVDRFLRFLQSSRQVRVVSARVLPCETVELNFSKGHGLTYNPTSVMFINVPSISKLQWHPFTVTSNSNLEPEKLSVVIKSEGAWTQKLYQQLSTSTIDRLGVSVEGPYGPASFNYLRHDTLVMVSGGSGITPFISIIRELIYQSTALKCKTPKVVLICAFKKSSSLSMLDLILPISGTPSDVSSLEVQIEVYITRDKELQSETPIHPQTILFKPKPTDAPVHAILGPNSWLWLGAIISSSFIIFLIIIGIITRFYIFPIDHHLEQTFSYSLRAFLNMIAICVSIAIVCSTAVLWNKKYNAEETKIQNLVGSSTTSSNSMINNEDRELESLPYNSLVQATNVHYGVRPDLKRLLFELKGTSVGVVVSGPKSLRHDVAAICSSGSAKNLHFESISFSW
ncbi:ferric reduction oxidase 2-like [Lotus japonicus]|uniref:ferric reduction oxidase 2-like n=1 Tax=Lotus japonicus TaxID=34305 RepID=UPI0025861AF4|nr:ferric reduction oxidase 2-like [Lotus japonicus]